MAAGDKSKMTLDEVKAQYRDDQWCGVEVTTGTGTVTVAFRKPGFRTWNEAVSKMLAQEKNPAAAIGIQKWLMDQCLLTHTPAELDQLLDEQPGLFSFASQKLTELVNTGVADAKKG